ncbi:MULTISPECIES: arylesterase [Leisingera]|jgi:acyl-CoA thioesterase-1|uniref:Arylesterase n=1 Tax=Leisingera aquaemixtae TaxID=1396826 RepID=A0A0P1HB02_9RHOB|nr:MULTISPECIES: arylesterase [Leisingera]QDI74742.1 arylesterase [Leisingera aquaemixtae]UWQ40778.1 arylesterase [Leisingera aquaemixtae]CUI00277.1 Esterase TesA precursor [Leisingera aquaemixtae]
MRKTLALLSLLLFTAPAWADPLRITALGDSLVQGYGLPQGQGLVPQLERWLNENGAEAVLQNAGVSGDTTAGGAERAEWTLSDNPDGLIVLLGGNDMLRGLEPQEARANLTRILQTAQDKGVEVLLIGMKAPRNYGPEYKQAFDAIYPELAAEFGAVLHPDAFAGMAAEAGGDPAAAQALMQDDGIHPNARGVALNAAAIGPAALQLIAAIGS